MTSLEIEGNTLTVDQITDLINNKRVLAPKKDIIEVKNAIEVNTKINDFNAFQLKWLCSAHEILMKGLIYNPGKLRHTSVGIVKGEHVAHIAPYIGLASLHLDGFEIQNLRLRQVKNVNVL